MPRHPLSTTLRIKRLFDTALLPARQHEEDSGWDLHAHLPDGKVGIPPHERRIISCGFAMQIDPGYEAQIRPRSGLAAEYGITVLNSPGTIDASYRGEVKVILYNTGSTTFIVEPEMRIAQMVLAAVPRTSLIEEEELSSTDRGSGGFGSTGK